MNPFEQPMRELRQALRQLMAQETPNPDDDPHLSGVMFFCATDEPTRQLVERIELLAHQVLFDATGRPIHARMRALGMEGVRIKLKQKVSSEETVIQLVVAGKGYVTVKTAVL